MSADPSGWDRRRQQLLDEYERIALELFAERGYHAVTVDEIAEVASVSPRTLFRYFATKEDILLALPRRGLAVIVASLRRLPPSDEPLIAAWRQLRTALRELAPDAARARLWRRAADGAPEVVARVRGERVEALIDAVAAYVGRSLGSSAATDVRDRVYAGLLAGADLALLESYGRADDDPDRMFDAAEAAIGILVTRMRRS